MDGARSEPERIDIRPQPGPQEAFCASAADIAIFGGNAGSGKTRALLLEAARHVDMGRYGGVIFRREATQITNEGGLWDSALELYPLFGARPLTNPRHMFRFPAGARVSFTHLNQEKDVHAYQGAQIPMIGFDELTHFTRAQFFYMISRNRTTIGIRPYIRATCNPDADSWVAELIGWWIDQDTGYAIPERSGRLRYVFRSSIDDTLHWADTREELVANFGVDPIQVKSLTFVNARIYDNPALMKKDPGYLANLQLMTRVERERLLGDQTLGGNWKIRPAAGLYFTRGDAVMLEAKPQDVQRWVRAWDLAATEVTEANNDPDYTAGVLIGRRPTGRVVIAHVERVRRAAGKVRELVRNTATQDGQRVTVRMFQDPGQAGKDQAGGYVLHLSGYPIFVRRVTGDKVTRASPLAAQWQGGNVEVVRGPWNEAFFAELEGFPDAKHDDQVDAAAEGFAALPFSGEAPDYSKGGIHRQNAAA